MLRYCAVRDEGGREPRKWYVRHLGVLLLPLKKPKARLSVHCILPGNDICRGRLYSENTVPVDRVGPQTIMYIVGYCLTMYQQRT